MPSLCEFEYVEAGRGDGREVRRAANKKLSSGLSEGGSGSYAERVWPPTADQPGVIFSALNILVSMAREVSWT
jgi:hypothetical protein